DPAVAEEFGFEELQYDEDGELYYHGIAGQGPMRYIAGELPPGNLLALGQTKQEAEAEAEAKREELKARAAARVEAAKAKLAALKAGEPPRKPPQQGPKS